jgi:hypothetical protein
MSWTEEVVSLLQYERRGNIMTVKCSVCNKTLAQYDEDTAKGWSVSDCEHFKWVRVSVPCYYDYDTEPDICRDVEQLKKKQLLRIDDGEYFLILVRGGDE